MAASVVNVNAGEEWDILIQRGTKWGNPYVASLTPPRGRVSWTPQEAKWDAINRYCIYHLIKNPELIRDAKIELADQRLGCSCKPSDCHGDVLAEIANHSDEHFEWSRGSGNAICDRCGRDVYSHRPYMGHLDTDSTGRLIPWLHVMCDGSLIKT